ncbi:MRC1-like domain-containing protein [Parachaetomium inaequale]|uniref:MRC1-like domain-containing protein n=1 Tax=Parachaetomium inaequale TaxID=2588326 RepID=A0AAN6PIH0_9PEZI|nr:MRC1-like domain-containing protein [Parachaetomium inaequale]
MASSRSPSPALRRSRSVSPTTATTRLIQQNRFDALSDSSSDEDAAILRPRGKMAARMQARGSENRESESETEDEDDANTTRSSPPRKTSDNVDPEPGKDGDEEDEEEDVITTRPRKLMSRRERSTTPETRPQDAASSPGPVISPQKSAPNSPGLFVSPSKPQSPSADQSDGGFPSPTGLTKNPRFKALVAKKRQERLAREAEEARKKAERRKAAGRDDDDDIMADDDDEDDNITDDDGGRKLTQEAAAARPPRKASKKALEEMNRETQRLTRSLQLAHEAKVKKKISKATLFERFNFKPGGAAAPAEETAPATSSSRAPTPGSVQQSDAEMKDAETPPSSPPAVGKEGESVDVPPAVVETTLNEVDDVDDVDDFPTLEEIQAAAARRKLKGKGKATAADLAEQPTAELPRKRNIRVKLPALQANTATFTLDNDDDDLQVVPTRKSKLDAIFDRIPANQAKQAHSLQILRRLAHLDDPDKKATPPSRAGNKLKKQHQETTMTSGELHVSLLQRARQQAKLERDRHLEMLRAKGIHVQTAEEREREMLDVEDMVAKARREAEEIMDRERDDAKAERKRRRDAGEEDPLGWDDESDDEDYVEEGEVEEAEVEEKELELSGSEEEGDEGLIDDAAEVADESETEEVGEQVGDQASEDEELPSSKQVRRRPRKHVTIVTDDEDDAEPLVKATPRPKAHFPKSPSVRNAESPSVPTSVLRSATKTFIPGLPVAGPAGLGLTQIFAGTMDDSQMGLTQASPSQPRPTFDVTAFPDSNFSQTAQGPAEDMIRDSQPNPETQQAETQGVQLRFSQSQVHGFDTFLEEGAIPTQMSELLEPTQDAGFHNFSPLRQRFVEPPLSTVETVPAGRTQAEEQGESPLVRRTGKLRRRADVVPASPTRRAADGEDEPMEGAETDEFGFGTTSNNAFAAMNAAALKEKKRKEAFDKKKSKARDMVEEQAEESEDEYAGLGGADGEDSDDDDQSVKEMIDDETKENEGDERKLAAFYADRERADDEKRVEKLFHDVTTGQLRRKRNGNWDDLSDSDDGGEARRRMKRRQFAKMQRTLYADERISKVAENPRNQAFMRTIEDRGSDDDMDFIHAPPPAPAVNSQDSQGSTTGPPAIIPNSQPQQPAPAPNPRRTKTGKKPSNIGEIRESLSNLLDEPFHASSSLIPATDPGSSDDDADERPQSSHSNSSASSNKENRNPRRRTKPAPAIIDRINLKRNSSTASSNSSNKLAFTAATTGTSSSFKVPALLRRATTNSLLSTSSTSSSTTTTSGPTNTNTNTNTNRPGGAGTENMKIKKPAGKRSGVSYLARETERRAAVAEAERRREAKKFRGVEGRGKAVGGLFGGGRFE